jgi:hypothetical protein
MSNDRQPVKVPADVLEGLKAVRESGKTNMLDRRGVIAVAGQMEFYATAVWAEENREAFGRGFRDGYEAEDAA